jgi:hypothetical protein
MVLSQPLMGYGRLLITHEGVHVTDEALDCAGEACALGLSRTFAVEESVDTAAVLPGSALELTVETNNVHFASAVGPDAALATTS